MFFNLRLFYNPWRLTFGTPTIQEDGAGKTSAVPFYSQDDGSFRDRILTYYKVMVYPKSMPALYDIGIYL